MGERIGGDLHAEASCWRRQLPAWCRVGTPVWYYPHAMPGAPRYLGMIASEPRLLGDTPVVRLGRMESAYGRSGVAAAAVFALEPVADWRSCDGDR